MWDPCSACPFVRRCARSQTCKERAPTIHGRIHNWYRCKILLRVPARVVGIPTATGTVCASAYPPSTLYVLAVTTFVHDITYTSNAVINNPAPDASLLVGAHFGDAWPNRR